ncbi:xanthine dehydrogenase family protein molybdopterin-binding subunit [Vineibacter terrae]|uniref:xanthine dehydrogenase family protein molybdopterin-binding subunit n=1 Tax=Vineibacter terrae TaxID=2586908 RepID=UPI002E314904|nr:xanthine dehydrogenase family protein molybdopterin-binding subunit [Vineibacter terrae]HEX2885355.1 xanthine dehydrogenase family protein molybdopterin-binding subunit [Vineibacter terrae]
MNAAAPQPRENQGQPAPRIDGRLKVTGGARYAADLPLNNLAHAVLVTSDIARGKVAALHLDKARAVPGVLDIVSYGDVDGISRPVHGNTSATSLGPLHEKTIMHDGQIMALVVADTLEAASEAAELVRADYTAERPSASLDSPGTQTEPAAGASEMYPEDPETGDFDKAFATAPVKLEAEYVTAPETHNPIELFSTTCAWTDDQLTLYEPTQNVHGFKAEIARQLQIDPAKVRVVCPYVGGAFGSKGPMTPRTAIVALAARRLKRPVRCVVSRMQGYTTATYRAETRHRIRMGATPDGRITAFGHEGWELTSRTDNYVVGGVDTTSRMYGYGAVACKVHLVKADRQTPGYMRSPPETPYMFPLESAMDELAARLAIDPVALRRINDTRTDPVSGKPYSSRSLMQCYDEAARAFGWSKRDPRPGAMRDGDWLIGWGCATACYPTYVGAATARVHLSADGQVLVQSASHEIGTGIRTVAAQMAAEQLGVEIAAVTVEMGDTGLPPAPVSGGSVSTASVCSAVMKACADIRGRLFRSVVTSNEGPLAGRDAARLALKDGKVIGGDGTEQMLAEAFKAVGVGVIEAYAEFVPQGAPGDAARKLYQGKSTLVGGGSGEKVMYAFGAEFVEVRVRARTREIRVPRMVGAFAGGRIMNTRTARSQLMGGMIWGLGAALHEETQIDPRHARTVNRDLQDYLVAVNADVGDVQVILVPEVDADVNPAGIKGLGELGNVGTSAAIANAIHHATGLRIRHLPIRLDDLLAA